MAPFARIYSRLFDGDNPTGERPAPERRLALLAIQCVTNHTTGDYPDVCPKRQAFQQQGSKE
jgi:hypothetical protein